MYTIISGTNRIGSHTEKVAKEYQQILKEKNIDAQIFTLKNLDVLDRSPEIIKTRKRNFNSYTKIYFYYS